MKIEKLEKRGHFACDLTIHFTADDIENIIEEWDELSGSDFLNADIVPITINTLYDLLENPREHMDEDNP